MKMRETLGAIEQREGRERREREREGRRCGRRSEAPAGSRDEREREEGDGMGKMKEG